VVLPRACRAWYNAFLPQSSEFTSLITLTINGASHSFEQAISVAQLLQHLGLVGKRLALERNGEIVPRSQFDAVQLESGDKLEIVVAVGGG
jgi:sulfur carrier protein